MKRRASDRDNLSAQLCVVPSERLARQAPTDLLHDVIEIARLGGAPAATKGIIEAELRRREAWKAPAGRAFWISVLALAVSVIAIVVSVVRGFR
jgi:hypothetical protein